MPHNKRLIFISHSGKDTWVARQIAREISDCGAEPFLDQLEIEVGENFEDKIRASLRRADELLVLLTPWALDRPYVWAELGAAWGKGLPIIGILHGMSATELQTKPGVPVFLKADNLLELNDIELYFRQLRERLSRKRSRKAAVGESGKKRGRS
jgi:hypothetical protein